MKELLDLAKHIEMQILTEQDLTKIVAKYEVLTDIYSYIINKQNGNKN